MAGHAPAKRRQSYLAIRKLQTISISPANELNCRIGNIFIRRNIPSDNISLIDLIELYQFRMGKISAVYCNVGIAGGCRVSISNVFDDRA